MLAKSAVFKNIHIKDKDDIKKPGDKFIYVRFRVPYVY